MRREGADSIKARAPKCPTKMPDILEQRSPPATHAKFPLMQWRDHILGMTRLDGDRLEMTRLAGDRLRMTRLAGDRLG